MERRGEMHRLSSRDGQEELLAQQEEFLKSKEAKHVNIMETGPTGWTRKAAKSRERDDACDGIDYLVCEALFLCHVINRTVSTK